MPTASPLYSFLYTLTFQGENGALPIPQLRRRHRGRPGPLDPDRGGHLPLRGLHRPRGPGPSGGTGHHRHSRGHLDLVVTDTSYVGAEDPWQFFPSVEFAVELEETSAPVSFESAQRKSTTKCSTAWTISPPPGSALQRCSQALTKSGCTPLKQPGHQHRPPNAHKVR